MNLFQKAQFNGKFMGANSAKPIAGVCASNAYKRNLVEAKVASGSANIVVGGAVAVTNNANGETASINAGKNFAPTTLLATSATASAGNGFAVMSPNAIVEGGSDFPFYIANQVIGVALIGSGAEIYLPCDSTLIGATNPIYWDGEKLVSEANAPSGDAVIDMSSAVVLSSVVDGVYGVLDSDGNAVSTEVSVVKVKI